MNAISKLMRPASVAVIGASADAAKTQAARWLMVLVFTPQAISHPRPCSRKPGAIPVLIW